MFRSIGKYVRAMGYLVTGRIDAARRAVSRNPHVVKATYDRVVDEKKKRIAQYKDAVAQMIAQEEKKAQSIRQLSEEVNRLEQLKEGAAAKARQLVAQLKSQGQDLPAIKANPEYQKCMTAFNDFTSTAAEKHGRIQELENDVEELGQSIQGHKVQLQELLREVEKIRSEASEAVADMITSREEEQIADMISGISQDRTGQELAELRDLRQQSKAKARVSRELAGTDTQAQEAQFMAYARETVATDEFDRLIGLAEEAETQPGSPQTDAASKARLPE